MNPILITGGDDMTVLFALVFFGMLAALTPRFGTDSRQGMDPHRGTGSTPERYNGFR